MLRCWKHLLSRRSNRWSTVSAFLPLLRLQRKNPAEVLLGLGKDP